MKRRIQEAYRNSNGKNMKIPSGFTMPPAAADLLAAKKTLAITPLGSGQRINSAVMNPPDVPYDATNEADVQALTGASDAGSTDGEFRANASLLLQAGTIPGRDLTQQILAALPADGTVAGGTTKPSGETTS